MLLSDISVKRPVFASVMSLLLVVFGMVAFDRLSLREYPDIDPPIVSIQTSYPGAAANVVETRLTEIIEDRIAGVEGIKSIQSSSQDGQSNVTIEFSTDMDIDSAANDIRDRVSSILDDLPEEADPPEIQKVDANEDVILWMNLVGKDMTVPELTDYADRYLVDRFSVLDGVARVRIGGEQLYAMRVWLDRKELAARNLTVNDVEEALRAENVELPAGSIESSTRQFTIRTQRSFKSPEDFAKLVLAQGKETDGTSYLIRLGDVARVELGTIEDRTFFRGNGIPQVGVGIIRQSTANTIEVSQAAKEEMKRVNANLPEGMSLEESYDTSVFVQGAINEVYSTLFIAIALVIFVIYIFLGSVRATIVPAITVPISLIATFIVLLMFGFSINLLTLLALVLAIGLVVDDAIVVLENIVRRIQDLGEPPLLAAYRGTRQVGFAVIATTAVLIAVFVPISFLQGDIGRLFREFALTMAAAVAFSSFVALTVSPMLASKLLKREEKGNRLIAFIDNSFRKMRHGYSRILPSFIRPPAIVVIAFIIMLIGSVFAFKNIPSEYTPNEDRGAFFILVNGPEGASYDYMLDYMNEIERRLMPYTESQDGKNPEVTRLLIRAPRSFGTIASFNSGIAIIVLDKWGKRRSGFTIMNEIREKLSDLPGVRAFPIMRQGFSSNVGKPVQFVIGGGTYEDLAKWRDILLEKINENNPGLVGIDWDYKETKPQIEVIVDYDRAAKLGVQGETIGRTLETMLGSRRVTTFIQNGEEYDVVVEGERDTQRTPTDMANIYIRSDRSGELIPLSNLVSLKEIADSNSLNRYNRVRSITIEANLADGYSLGDALTYLEKTTREYLPPEVIIDYKGLSQDLKFSGDSIVFIFLLGIFVTFLVLAAQFESWIHPLVIMFSVPLAISGALFALYFTGNTLNLYSQIGLVMLVGLAAKNGILIVEFANQLRDEGKHFYRALLESSALRLRPIVMTSITTAAGSIPLILSSGAGSETRIVIGIVIMAGVLASTFFTIFVIPVAYSLLAKHTGSPMDVTKELEKQNKTH